MLIPKSGTASFPDKRVCRCRGVAVLAVLVFLCCMCVMPTAAAYHEVMNAGDLKDVITWSNTGANTSTAFLVVVNSDIAFNGNAWLPEISGNITLTTNSSASNKIYRTAANTTVDTGMFTIGDGGNLTITNNATTLITSHWTETIL